METGWMEKIEVNYSGTDILAVNAASWRFWVWTVGFIAALLLAIRIVLILSDGYSFGEAVAAIDWTFTGIVLLALVAWIVIVSVSNYWWRRWKGQLGPITFALSAEGVSFQNREMDGLVFWKAIRSVRTQGSRTFLFLTHRSAFIFPRRAFQRDADFEAFSAAARDYWNTARP